MPAERPNRVSKEHAEAFPLRVLDPIELMKDNAAFSSLDPEALAGDFNPKLFKPIDFVRVEYPGNEIQPKIRDGHNRTAGAAQYKETPQGKDFVFTGQDITQQIIDQRYGGQGENLTPIQYLESIGGPTKKEFVEVRMAGHIMTEWDGIVGKDAAQDLPALAALSMLSFSPLGLESPKIIAKRIKTHDKIIAKETPEKRDALESGIVQVATVIRNVQRVYDDITQAAFTIVGNELPPEKLQEQAKGFLSLPEVDAKIKEDSTEEEIAQRSELLEASLMSAIKERGEIRDRRALYQLLTDKTLSFGMTNSLLQPSDKKLMIRYNELKDEQHDRKDKSKREKKDEKSTIAARATTDTGEQPTEKIVYQDTDFTKDLAPLKYISALQDVQTPVNDETLAKLMTVQHQIARIIELTRRGQYKKAQRSPNIHHSQQTPSSKVEEKVRTLPTKEQLTQRIESSAKSFFPSLEEKWPQITAVMRKNDHITGKDTRGDKAVEEALSARLLNIMTRLQLKPTSDEVTFLSANHYLLGLRGEQQTAVSTPEVDNYEAEMTQAINTHLRTKDHHEKLYLTLLQFSVYGPIGNPNLTQVLSTLQKYKKRPNEANVQEGITSYNTYLKESNLNDIQDIFNFRILGARTDK